MILILACIMAVFLAGIVCGVFVMVVIGIHAEEHRTTHQEASRSSIAGTASGRFLRTQTCDTLPDRPAKGR